MDSKLIRKASEFSEKRHRDQKRKYTGEPYFNHLIEVAVTLHWAGSDEHLIAAGFLHDVVEDQNVSFTTLLEEFGRDISQLVMEVTDVSKPSDGNRAVRKKLDREHLITASPRGKTLKLADMISNTPSILERDPSFARVYLEEKRLLLPHLQQGNPVLFSIAKDILERASI